ncbi:hypothetical protein F5Y05DRAFT_80047 [Hypoxylon sp. FL0543]|nr:hypothetical protein F5Y05DRAFT_80047 [Hypoxylon sp. FL0543]
MAKSQEWFEVPHRSYGATTAIYQVGQIITDPFDLESALFRNGSFNGKPSHEISQEIRQRKALTLSYSKTASSFEVSAGHVTTIEGARIDGKGDPILWQVLEEERIYRTDKLLDAVIQEEEITRHLARTNGHKPLYLVTDVIKVQEIIPEYYDPGRIHPAKVPSIRSYSPPPFSPYPSRPPSPDPVPSARFPAPSPSEDLHLPVGFDGRKHGKSFIWKYKLERINNPDDIESVFAERISPTEALSDQEHAIWIILFLKLLLGWIWAPSRPEPMSSRRAGDSSVLSARPTTLEWKVELENITPSPLGEPNGTPTHIDVAPPAYRIPFPPGSRLRGFSRARTYEEASTPSEESDEDSPIRPRFRRRVARSLTNSLPRKRGRKRRGTSFWGKSADASDWESKSMLIPYQTEDITYRPTSRARAVYRAPESVHSVPATAEDIVDPALTKAAETPDQHGGIQALLSEAQATVNGIGNDETAHSSTKTPILPTNLTAPTLNSPPSGIPHAEYDVLNSESAELANHLSQGDDAIKEGRKWFDDVEYMKRVNKFFKALRSGRPNERAKIAVLDTGLDFDHLLLRPFIESKQLSQEHSLDFTAEPNRPVKGDSVGHGTHCTHLILKTCETAEIYVAKVFKKKKADQYTATCVAKAIDHAVNTWKVDIVSMSFSFSADQKPIEEAIKKAQNADKKVLFLAAASNLRMLAQHPVGFPANYNTVISVFSHNPSGERSKFSPKRPGAQNFSVLGEHLNAAFPRALNEGDFERRESVRNIHGNCSHSRHCGSRH